MTPIQADTRSPQRRAKDEAITSEPQLPHVDLPSDAVPASVETHLRQVRHPVAHAGVVENGMVRFLDPAVKLPERSRVIVVAESA